MARGLVDHSGMKLGRQEARFDHRVPCLSDYRMGLRYGALPKPAASASWVPPSLKVPKWSMSLNDKLGDCTIAALAHIQTQWTAYTRPAPAVMSDAQVLGLYEKWTGYNPADPTTDRGAVMLDIATRWWTEGAYGDKLTAFVQVDYTNQDEVRDAIAWFGNVYVGVDLPLLAQRQVIWSVPWYGAIFNAAPGGWGGHCVPVMGYDTQYLTCITWGAPKKLTWGWWKAYVVECFALLDSDWLAATGVTPGGLNLDQLRADMSALKS